MTKLTDLQAILLSSASQRVDASLLPLPESTDAQRAAKAIAALIKRGLIEERETTTAEAYRTDGDLRYGVFATTAGLAAIGVGEPAGQGDSPTPTPSAAPAPVPVTKKVTVIALLGRDTGATLTELIAATGWLPHTTRAALTGLRKAGHDIERGKRDDVTCYRIVIAQ